MQWKLLSKCIHWRWEKDTVVYFGEWKNADQKAEWGSQGLLRTLGIQGSH